MRRISFHSLVPLAEKSTSSCVNGLGEPIGEVAVATPEVEFVVAHAKCGDLLEVSRGKFRRKTHTPIDARRKK